MNIYAVKLEYLEPTQAELEASGNNPDELQENLINYFTEMGAIEVKITYIKDLGPLINFQTNNGTIQ